MKRVLSLLVALSIAAVGAAAQQFRSGVDVVSVDALVTEGGRAITGLKAEDFQLRDNGVLQEIDSVAVDDAPISMLLALDASNSVEGPTLDHLKQAAITAVDALAANDRAAVMTFAESVLLRADWAAATAATRTAIATAESGGSTSLYDAGYAALTLQDTVPGRRSYILLFSDGGDTSSWLPASALLERARRSDAVVYVVTRRAPRPDVRLEYRSGIELWTPPTKSPSDSPTDDRTGDDYRRSGVRRAARRRAPRGVLGSRLAVSQPLSPRVPAPGCRERGLALDRFETDARSSQYHRPARLREIAVPHAPLTS